MSITGLDVGLACGSTGALRSTADAASLATQSTQTAARPIQGLEIDMTYIVEVGNIGQVARGKTFLDVYQKYLHYVGLSIDDNGRAAGEDVTLFSPDGEPIREYWGSLHDGDYGQRDEMLDE